MGVKRTIREAMRERGYRVPTMLLPESDLFVRSVANTLAREDTVIDLGAHVGTVSREFAHRAGKVYAFEPHPETFSRLTHNVRNYPRVEPINAAVFDSAGSAQLFHEPTGTAKFTEGATLVEGKSNVGYDKAFEVETVRLSDFVLGLGGPVRLIKMDIEGAEYRVIEDLI